MVKIFQQKTICKEVFHSSNNSSSSDFPKSFIKKRGKTIRARTFVRSKRKKSVFYFRSSGNRANGVIVKPRDTWGKESSGSGDKEGNLDHGQFERDHHKR